jgi:hypothetical protein
MIDRANLGDDSSSRKVRLPDAESGQAAHARRRL